MTCGFTDCGRLLIKTTPGCDAEFAADNRLDAVGMGLSVKIKGTEHVAVVGDGDSRHCVFFGLPEEITQPDCAFEKTVFCVNMKVNKICFINCHFIILDEADII